MQRSKTVSEMVWKRITQSLAMVVTIAFPFLVITLLPVEKVVGKLDQVLDRLGPLAILVFIVAYIANAVLLGPAWLFASSAEDSSSGSRRRSRPAPRS